MISTTQKLISVSSALEGQVCGAAVAVRVLYLASTAPREAHQTSADECFFSTQGAPQL